MLHSYRIVWGSARVLGWNKSLYVRQEVETLLAAVGF